MNYILQVPERNGMYFCGVQEEGFRKYAYDASKALVYPSKEDAELAVKELSQKSSYTFIITPAQD